MSTTRDRPALMTHLVAYYPSRELSLAVARAMLAGGAAMLEVQFPFSDPSADGKLIQTACSEALAAGFRVDGGFALVQELCRESPVPVLIMSYANLVVRRGVAHFVDRAKQAGAAGLIIPDLMPGYDEGLFDAAAEAGIDVVPVVAPSVGEARLAEIAKRRPAWLYAALRVGITGRYTELGSENRRFLERLEPIGSRLIAGFGIRTREQVESLSGLADAVVVGSALVQVIQEAAEVVAAAASPDRLSEAVRAKVAELSAVALGPEGRLKSKE